jgi:hypothetical protein
MNFSREAELTVLDVSEGFCPLCHVTLIRHGDRACCPCGGCSFSATEHTLVMRSCGEHPPNDCEHWQEIWQGRL